MSYRLSTNMLATARAVNTEISTGTAQSICPVISNTITATDTVPVTPPDDNASCEVSANKGSTTEICAVEREAQWERPPTCECRCPCYCKLRCRDTTKVTIAQAFTDQTTQASTCDGFTTANSNQTSVPDSLE